MQYNVNKSDKILHLHSCRICLKSKCINLVSLDDQNGWLQLFEYCFGISLSTQDKHRNLCGQCAKRVKSYSKFKDLCHKSDKLWKSFSNVKCTNKNQPYKIVKDEIIDHEQIGIVNISSYTNAELFNSNLNDFNDETEDFESVPIKNEDVSNETLNDVSFNTNSSDTIHVLTKDVHLKHNIKTNKKETSIPSITSKVKDLFICKICQKKYGSQLWYLKHLKSCKSKRIAYPNQEHKSGTDIHLQENNKILKDYRNMEKQENFLSFCGVCKFSSTNEEEVDKHLDGHWTNKDLQCMLCDFIGKDQAALAAHRYNHYTAKTCNFLCHICRKKTKSQLTLQFHYRKVHLNKVGGLCSQPRCDKVYNSWKLWKRHEKLHCHPGYICDFCGQKYRHKHLIVEHLSNHINPTTYVCDVCGKTFLRLRNLRIHIENVHVKSEPIKCSHCDRMFKNQHYLRIHQKLLAMEKVFKCEFCPLEYPQLSLLNSHLKSHSDERPHCCHICGSRYKAKSQLAIHMRNHTGDRPYKCSLCGKAFKSAQLLRRHTMIHTGIMPHKCLHCEKTFICKKRMMNHCTMRHKTLDKNNCL